MFRLNLFFETETTINIPELYIFIKKYDDNLTSILIKIFAILIS